MVTLEFSYSGCGLVFCTDWFTSVMYPNVFVMIRFCRGSFPADMTGKRPNSAVDSHVVV